MMTRSSLFLIALLAFPAIACSAEVAPSTEPPSTPAPEPSTPPEGSATTPPPSSPSPSSPPGKSDSPQAPATLAIDSAAYRNTQAGSTSFAYALTFAIDNTSAEDVISLDEMTFDFGDGKKVTLNQSACHGTFAITAGEKKDVSIRFVASSSGDVQPAGFSMMCASSQSFGAGDGNAPPTASFSGPIAISASGKTKSGAFSASGTATRTP